MRIHRNHSFVIFIVIMSVLLSIGGTVVATELPDTFLEVRTFVLESQQQARLPLAEPDPPLRVFRPLQPTPAPTPEPLPTPVAPTDEAVGWIIPPPAPVPVATTVQSHVAYLLIWPISGRITTVFSSRHPAIDIANNCGTPVKADAAGTVTWVGWRNNGGGNVVEINHGWGISDFDHLSGFAVASGQQVVQGQVIAYVGSTGNSTGCHLHWALAVDGRWQNPLLYTQ